MAGVGFNLTVFRVLEFFYELAFLLVFDDNRDFLGFYKVVLFSLSERMWLILS
jgi:hypothetical protein